MQLHGAEKKKNKNKKEKQEALQKKRQQTHLIIKSYEFEFFEQAPVLFFYLRLRLENRSEMNLGHVAQKGCGHAENARDYFQSKLVIVPSSFPVHTLHTCSLSPFPG